MINILHGEVFPRHKVEIGKKLEQKAADAIAPSDKALSTPCDRLVHWLAEQGYFDNDAKDKN